MAQTLPYMNAYGNITKALEKIKSAAAPPRFTQDFLAAKLDLKGGSPKPLIPYLKRTGFLGSDGVPTQLYKEFRNINQSGTAAAQALRIGYEPLYEVNEYVHDMTDDEIKGVVVQVTGAEPDSGAVRSIMGSFRALRDFATFDADNDEAAEDEEQTSDANDDRDRTNRAIHPKTLGLSYTINLNLPPTSDITVFDAIFKSLKEHLLK